MDQRTTSTEYEQAETVPAAAAECDQAPTVVFPSEEEIKTTTSQEKNDQVELREEISNIETNLETLEGLAKALAIEVDTVFDFTTKLERLLHPEHREEENDEHHAEAEAMKRENAAILNKMSMLMRNAGSSKKEDEGEDKGRKKAPEIKIIDKPKREDYGVRLHKLKVWQEERDQQALIQETARQEVAVARVRGFLDAMRMLRRLQSWWRMMTFKMEFREFRNARLAIKRKFYNGWKQYWQAEHMFLYHSLGKPFEAWAAETDNAKQLKIIVKEFFNLCVKRLRLTPQAVMAYFAPPGEDSVEISEIDGMKIRRLILSKLFEGWKAEVRELRGQRFKASQILARTVRRSKGPMWVKEGVLVCFHIWHRYSAVRNAYRREEPDPQFKNPHLPQWTKLLSKITLSRIHRKRAHEKGENLTMTRALKTWKLIMTMDKSKLLTPLQIAINHWNWKVWTKVFGGWSLHLRERGTIMRIRDKCFAAWKLWSPRKRRLRILKAETIEWLALRQKRTVVNEMTSQCFDVIG